MNMAKNVSCRFSSCSVLVLMLTIKLNGDCDLSVFSCPWLSEHFSVAVPIYNGVIFLFVLANFCMATFMDPGIFPRGQCVNDQMYLLKSKKYDFWLLILQFKV